MAALRGLQQEERPDGCLPGAPTPAC